MIIFNARIILTLIFPVIIFSIYSTITGSQIWSHILLFVTLLSFILHDRLGKKFRNKANILRFLFWLSIIFIFIKFGWLFGVIASITSFIYMIICNILINLFIPKDWEPEYDGDGNILYKFNDKTYIGQDSSINDDEVQKRFIDLAEQGNEEAQYFLGCMYDNGIDVLQNYTEAIKWYMKSAEQGNEFAQNNLGCVYRSGQGVEQNYSEALKWFEKSAKQGYASAQYNLADMYDLGLGVMQNYAESAKWFEKAACQGHEKSQYNLGCMLLDGHGIKQNYFEAVKWLRKAADQGNEYGLYNLALLYRDGQGVKQDYTTAWAWFDLSVTNAKDKDVKMKAVDGRAEVEKLMTTEQIVEAQKIAREWKPKKDK